MEDAKPATALFERDVAAGNSCYSLPPWRTCGKSAWCKKSLRKRKSDFLLRKQPPEKLRIFLTIITLVIVKNTCFENRPGFQSATITSNSHCIHASLLFPGKFLSRSARAAFFPESNNKLIQQRSIRYSFSSWRSILICYFLLQTRKSVPHLTKKLCFNKTLPITISLKLSGQGKGINESGNLSW